MTNMMMKVLTPAISPLLKLVDSIISLHFIAAGVVTSSALV
jgi:hypothetical protein